VAFMSLDSKRGDNWQAIHGDCVDVVRQMPDESVGFSVYSPPFGSLFVYSESECDMGNSSSDGEFERHYQYMVKEKFRVTKPGRLSAVHCTDLPMTKWRDGHVGLKDFPGQIIRVHEDAGWIYHARVTIWKCPVVEMTRTKAVGLVYGQLVKDSSKSRVGLPDYLLIFRKPGDNEEPIVHDMGHDTASRLERPRKNIGASEIPLDKWQEWASPVWMTIDQTNVLNVKAAKDQQDEKHLCPLQLDVIERSLILWSNPGDVVLSPFMGIGSEGFCAMKLKRKFLGVELKDSYFRQACRNIDAAEKSAESLFDYEAA
jgi:DNA modification methylase